MMKNKIEMDEILDEFAIEFEERGEEALERFADEHPELIEILYEQAGVVRMLRHLPEADMTNEEEQARVLKSVSLVQNLLYERRKGTPLAVENSSVEIQSLQVLLAERNETFDSASATLGLSSLILEMLHKRRVRPGSIPRRLVDSLAELLGTTAEAIHTYLSMKPVQSGGFYKSDMAPTFREQDEFRDLIIHDPDLTQASKDYWISIPTIETEGN
jgi:hypothetical protein